MKKDSRSFVRSLRRNQTDAEKVLWQKLRSRQFSGFKFRRQQALEPYVADFCSFEAKLIIELDGGQHAENREKDERRTEFLIQKGFRVVRFWDHEVLVHLEATLEKIRQNILESPLTPALSRKGRGGWKKPKGR